MSSDSLPKVMSFKEEHEAMLEDSINAWVKETGACIIGIALTSHNNGNYTDYAALVTYVRATSHDGARETVAANGATQHWSLPVGYNPGIRDYPAGLRRR